MDIKIPYYNLVNMLLLGIIFVVCVSFLQPNFAGELFAYIDKYKIGETLVLVAFLATSYQIGFLISRLGSLTENLLKNEKNWKDRSLISKVFQIPWRNYSLYQDTEKLDPFVKVLSREYGLARNSMALCVLLAIIAGVCKNWIYLWSLIGLTLLSYLATRKHARKIVDRIDKNTKTKG